MHSRQTTLPDFDLFDPLPLQTTAPTYLHHNTVPDTEPTYIAAIPPADPPKNTPTYEPPGEQASLHDYAGTCPFCTADPDQYEKHLLLSHPGVINDALKQRKQERSEPDEHPDEPLRVNADGPVAFYEPDPNDTPGQSLTATTTNECERCGNWISPKFVSQFGLDHPSIDTLCRDCQPRSHRFTRDPIGSYASDSVASQTGSNNHNHAGIPND